MLTLYRVKLSTKIRKVSGQDLVPVLVDDGKVVIDSMEIAR